MENNNLKIDSSINLIIVTNKGFFMANFRYSIVTDDKERKKLAVLSQYAFFPSPNDLKRNELFFDYNKDCYILAVYNEENPEKAVAMAISIPMTQNLRGKVFRMDGIANVATEPVYRRQRLVATMMDKILNHDKKAGFPISCLYPFKESFYAKFGYITLPQVRIATLNLQTLTPLLADKSPFKSTKLDFKEIFSTFYDFIIENQKVIHGMAIKGFNSLKMIPEIRPGHLVFVYDDNDKIIGSMVYTTKGFHSELLISSFLYLNTTGKYLLFRYLALHTDQFSFVKFPVAPFEHPENWFDDLNLQISNREWIPAAMARIVDVEGLNDLAVGSGSIITKITDSNCSWNKGIFHLAEKSGKLSIVKMKSESSYECELTIQGLTALVYGNYSLEDLTFKKWFLELVNGAGKKIELLFPYKLPYIYDTF